MSHEQDESRRIPRRQLLKAAGLGGAFVLLESACGSEYFELALLAGTLK